MGTHAIRNERRSLWARIGLTAALLALLGAVSTVTGAFALFTDTETASQQYNAGTLTLDPINVNAAGNRLTVAANDIAPQDTIERAVTLVHGGTIDAGSFTLETAASVSSLLDTDTVDGLQVQVDRCSVPWTEAEPTPGVYTYTCGGTTQSVLASTPIIVTPAATLANMDLTAGASNHLRVLVTFPATADNTFQGLSSTVDFDFSVVQRAGIPR